MKIKFAAVRRPVHLSKHSLWLENDAVDDAIQTKIPNPYNNRIYRISPTLRKTILETLVK